LCSAKRRERLFVIPLYTFPSSSLSMYTLYII
jgi:hypothetical protein